MNFDECVKELQEEEGGKDGEEVEGRKEGKGLGNTDEELRSNKREEMGERRLHRKKGRYRHETWWGG